MNLKEVFSKAESDSLTFEQFNEIAEKLGAKFTDLSEGTYVSKAKYDSELSAKDDQVKELTSNISERDKNLKDLQKKLTDAGSDADKLQQVSNEFTSLKTKYEEDTKQYQEKLSKQAYEFAVKEYANGQKFSSKYAKKDFVNSMLKQGLEMKDGAIVDADKFVAEYSTNNADAFVKTEAEPKVPDPSFATPADKTKPQVEDTGFKFNFAGLRPRKE